MKRRVQRGLDRWRERSARGASPTPPPHDGAPRDETSPERVSRYSLDLVGPVVPRLLGAARPERTTLYTLVPPAPSTTPAQTTPAPTTPDATSAPAHATPARAASEPVGALFPHLPAATAAVLRKIPRAKALDVEPVPSVERPRMRNPALTASVWQIVQRLAVWFLAGALFAGGTVRDVVAGRDTQARRAARLRRTLERIGGTFIKLGQQLALRVDLIPGAYCDELSQMLDKVPPIRTAAAIAVIERATGRPLHETFTEFDPKPIGSASIGCVYLATRTTGERVAVKVLRPHIRQIFAADLTAFDLFLQCLELLTIARPGSSLNFRTELRRMLQEELDLPREARSTEIFRRSARAKGWRFLRAPRVHFDLSGEEVLVTEYVEGVWLTELLAAVEGGDAATLARVRALDIDPEKVARRLHYASMFGQFDCSLFHADPHPANIAVQPGNTLVFIDFGACGQFTEPERRLRREALRQFVRRDVAGLVRVALSNSEPLPPVDTHRLGKQMEDAYWDLVHALESKHAAWWEGTNSALVFATMRITSRYRLPMPINLLRILRATMLYDSVAARLSARRGHDDLIRKFWRRIERRERSEALAALRRRRDVDPAAAIADGVRLLRDARDLGHEVAFALQRRLDASPYSFVDQIRKTSYAVLDALHLAATLAAVASAATVAVIVRARALGHAATFDVALRRVLGNEWFLVLVGLLVLRHVRRLAYRFADPDVGADR